MKTRNSLQGKVILRLLIFLPLLLFTVFALNSCSASKKAGRLKTEIAPPPPPPPPVVRDDEPFVVVEEMPEFQGGDSMLLAYIGKNTKYPEAAKLNNIQGRVIVRFCVTKEGGVDRISVLRGVSSDLDAEAVRVVSTLPSFKPGKQGGKSVDVWYMIPITFTLKGDAPKRPSRYEVIGTDTIYSYSKEMPRFSGGNDALDKFKSENAKYPQELKNLGIEGAVLVRFMIDKDGSVSNVRILQGASPSLDAEAIKATKLMPAWLPGKENGKPVKFYMMTDYEFLLSPRVPPVIEEGTPFVVVEEMPMFPGGDSALLAYISQNTKYPEKAKANKVEGRVIVRFCVTDVGGIDRVTVLKGVDADLDAEAVRVVSTLPKFKPGKQGGKPVSVWYMVPITFGLVKPADPSALNRPPKAPPQPQGYDEAPQFPGGETALYKLINSKLVYPKTAKENLISGIVTIRFSIGTDGSVGEVSVLKGVNSDLDAEAIRVTNLMPAWKPGKLENNPVKVWYILPIKFSLK